MQGVGVRGRIIALLLRIRLVREAAAERTDLSELYRRPTPRIWTGLVLIGLSYLLGWPAVGLFALLAYHLEEPLVLAVGGPLIYGLSYLVFLAGAWLSGSRYAMALLRWGTRRVLRMLSNS